MRLRVAHRVPRRRRYVRDQFGLRREIEKDASWLRIGTSRVRVKEKRRPDQEQTKHKLLIQWFFFGLLSCGAPGSLHIM